MSNTKTTPQSDSNLDVTLTESANLISLDIQPVIFNGGGGGTGTVTNVATGLGLTGGPITTTGTVSIDETSDITFNSVTADFFGVQHFTAKARETITAGQPVYISGHSGNTPEVMVADFDDPAKMPAFGIASADIANNNNGSISTYGDLKDVDTTGTTEGETWAVGDSLYVNGSKLTNIRPTGSAEEVQKIAKIIRVHANTGQMFLMGAGRSNDTPNLAHYNVFIGNAGGVEKRQLTYTDILNTPTIPTQTTVNNNANNRVITGSDTVDTLEGESNFTWDGSNGLMSGTSNNYDSPILHLKTDTSGYNKTQLLCEDDNGKVFSQVGQLNTGGSLYQWNITLDPDNTHGRTGVTTYAGDYFVSFEKNYSTQSAIRMDMNVYGANDGFVIKVRDDFNSGGGNQYGHKPLVVDASEFIFRNNNGDELIYPQNDGTVGQAITTDGAGNLTFTTVSGGGGGTLGGLSDVDLVGLADGDILRYNGTATEWQNTNLGLTLTPTISVGSAFFGGADATATITNWASYDDPNIWAQVEDSGGNIIKTNAQLSAGMDLSAGTVTWNVGTTIATGYKIKIRVQDFGDLASDIAESTYDVEAITVNSTFRYYRLTDFSGFADTGSLPTSGNRVMVGTFRLWSSTGGTGTQYPPNMTSDTAPSPNVALASRLFSGYDYYKAFDTGQNNTFWWNLGDTPAQALSAWIQIDLGASYNVRSIQIAPGQSGYAFTGAKIYGSDTGSFTGEESLVLDATGLLSPWSSTANFILG